MNTNFREAKLLIAGGGTGGHLFTGIALAEEWVNRGGEVVFVGTPRGLEKDLIPKLGYRLELIPVSSIKGGGGLHLLKTLLGLPRSFFKSFQVIRKIKPKVVIGIGGYVSGPVVLMARFMGYKTAVIDQNSIPGLTNRILGRIVHLVFLNYKESVSFFNFKKTRVFGNPVIKDRMPKMVKREEKCILVCGGSQGAHAVNQKVLEALPQIMRRIPELKIIFQTGAKDYEMVKGYFKQAGINGEIAPFFDNMQDLYRRAQLVVSRAGAGTLTELALWGMPSILIPYPFAADDHQRFNAELFVNKGAARILDQQKMTGEVLAEQIITLLLDEHTLTEMSINASSLAKPNAAKDVVNELLNMC